MSVAPVLIIQVQEGHGFSNLLGPRNQGFWSKINCSQMKLLYFVNLHSVGPIKLGLILESVKWFKK